MTTRRYRSSIGGLVGSFLAGFGSALVFQVIHARYCNKTCPLCGLLRPKTSAPAPATSGCGGNDPSSRCANCTCWKSRVPDKQNVASTNSKTGRVTLNVGALTTLQELNQVGTEDIAEYLSS